MITFIHTIKMWNDASTPSHSSSSSKCAYNPSLECNVKAFFRYVSVSGVDGDRTILYLDSSRARATLICSIPKCDPKHVRGPTPKGM